MAYLLSQVQALELEVPFFPGEEGVVCCIVATAAWCVGSALLAIAINDNNDVYAANVHTVTGGHLRA